MTRTETKTLCQKISFALWTADSEAGAIAALLLECDLGTPSQLRSACGTDPEVNAVTSSGQRATRTGGGRSASVHRWNYLPQTISRVHPLELPTSALIAAIIRMNWTLALIQANVVDLHRSAQRPFGTVAQAGCLFQNGGPLLSSVCFLCSPTEQKSSSVFLRAGRIHR